MLLGSQLRHELGRFPHVTQVAFSSSSLPKPYHLAGGPKYFLLVTTIFSVPSKKTRLFRPPCFVSRVTRLSFDNQPTEHSTLQSSQFLRSISGWCLIQIYSWSSNIFTSVSQLGHRSRRLLRRRLYLSLVPPPCLFLFRPSLFRTYCLSTHVGTLNNQTELNFFGNMKTCLAKFNGSLLEAIQIGAQHRYSFIPSSLFPFRGLPAFNSTINLLLASSLKIS